MKSAPVESWISRTQLNTKVGIKGKCQVSYLIPLLGPGWFNRVLGWHLHKCLTMLVFVFWPEPWASLMLIFCLNWFFCSWSVHWSHSCDSACMYIEQWCCLWAWNRAKPTGPHGDWTPDLGLINSIHKPGRHNSQPTSGSLGTRGHHVLI